MSDTDPRSRRTVLKVAGGVAGLASLPALSAAQDGTETTAGQQSTGERVGMVTGQGGAQLFSAPVLWVEQGATVTWYNDSGSHSTTAYARANDKPQRIPQNAEAWDSGILSEQGATFDHTFDTPGVYDYYCTPHESLGMVGRVVVGSPDLGNAPAMTEPQSSLPQTVRQILTGMNTLTRAMFGSG